MNNSKNIFFLFLGPMLFFSTIYTDNGCMDWSKHAYYCNDGVKICNNESRYHNDSKQWHRVPCACPCWKYKPSTGRQNICVYCGHAHVEPGTSASQDIRYPKIALRCAPNARDQRPAYYVPKKIQRNQN